MGLGELLAEARLDFDPAAGGGENSLNRSFGAFQKVGDFEVGTALEVLEEDRGDLAGGDIGCEACPFDVVGAAQAVEGGSGVLGGGIENGPALFPVAEHDLSALVLAGAAQEGVVVALAEGVPIRCAVEVAFLRATEKRGLVAAGVFAGVATHDATSFSSSGHG